MPLRDSEYTRLIQNYLDINAAVSDKSFDRIVITLKSTEDFTIKAGLFRFDLEFDLGCAPKEVSDRCSNFTEYSAGKDTEKEFEIE